MSKKWVTLLLVVCIGLAGGVGFMRMNADTEGPEIVFTSEAPSVYRSDMSNEELLTGVTASENPDTADHAEENADVAVVEETPTPTPEVDEAAAEKEKQEAEANTMPDQNPRIYLTDYLIKVPVGTSVDLLSYVSEIKDDSDDAYALWRKVQITGEVNSAVPGTYKCTYYVIDSQNNISNNAVLTVIVE